MRKKLANFTPALGLPTIDFFQVRSSSRYLCGASTYIFRHVVKQREKAYREVETYTGGCGAGDFDLLKQRCRIQYKITATRRHEDRFAEGIVGDNVKCLATSSFYQLL